MDLSIIIVCYKGWKRLRKCLSSIDSFTGSLFSYEVIIVDNNSGDEELSQIEQTFSRFFIVRNKYNGGFGNGCNLGAEKASGEYILFLNPDTVVIEAELYKLLNSAKKIQKPAIFSCRQINEKGRQSIAYGSFPAILNLTGFQRAIGKLFTKEVTATGNFNYPDWVSGSVILIRKEAFIKLNGFDEDFWMYFEDVDLCKRMRKNGGQIVFCNNVSIEHNHGGSSRINIKTSALTKTEVIISRHLYISKHLKGLEKYLIQTFLVINNIFITFITGVFGVFLFFIPKAIIRSIILFGIIKYYFTVLVRYSWISPRSVSFQKNLFNKVRT